MHPINEALLDQYIRYDVFISHNPDDREWVDTWLLPRLQQVGLQVAVDYRDFVIGASKLSEIERVVCQSRRTIVILTPAWLENEWNDFEGILARSMDPAMRTRRLLAIKLKPCEIPSLVKGTIYADLTAERVWNQQLRRIVRDIEDVVPVDFQPPWRDSFQFRRWMRRYRRPIRLAALSVFLACTLLAMVFQLPPFAPRMAWTRTGGDFPAAHLLYINDDRLFVGARNPQEGCHPSPSIWSRPLIQSEWTESAVEANLCIRTWTPPSLSDITGIASFSDDPNTIYVLTSHSGLLVSHNGGHSFTQYASPPPISTRSWAERFTLGGTPDAPEFWVLGFLEGIFVYRDGAWTRLDGSSPELPALSTTSIWVDGDTILVGTERQGLWISRDSGHHFDRVFDQLGRYMIRQFKQVYSSAHERYLIVVRDDQSEGEGQYGIWQLLDLCVRPEDCSDHEWVVESVPLWHSNSPVADLVVQRNNLQADFWYLITVWGTVWRSDVRSAKPEKLAGFPQCLLSCTAAFTPSAEGEYPYVLVRRNVPPSLKFLLQETGYVFHYEQGTWWRRIYP